MAAPDRVKDMAEATVVPPPAALHETRQTTLRRAAGRCARRLYDTYGARTVYLFGSLAKGGPIHDGTDIDLVVEGLAPERYFNALADLWHRLPEGVTLDLVPLEAALPSMRARVWKEGQIMSRDGDDPGGAGAAGAAGAGAQDSEAGPFTRALRADVEQELVALERLVTEMTDLRSAIGRQDARESPTSVQVRAAGSILHDFYTAIERALSRIAVAVDGGLPAGPDWHMQLLRRMAAELPEVRSAVLDEELERALGELLRLRHLIRNVYGFELDWERMRPLADRLPWVSAAFAAAVRRLWES